MAGADWVGAAPDAARWALPVWSEIPFDSRYYRVTVDPSLGVVRATRSAAEYPTADAAADDLRGLLELVRTVAEPRLLIDLRGSPRPRSEQDIEGATNEPRREIHRHFERVAILVRSAIGRLQVLRLLKRDGVEGAVVFDEDEALRYLA